VRWSAGLSSRRSEDIDGFRRQTSDTDDLDGSEVLSRGQGGRGGSEGG